MYIKEVSGRIIKNSRREKTIEIVVRTLKGKFSASSPEGKSKGKYERKDFNKFGIKYSLRLLNKFCENLREREMEFKTFNDLKSFEENLKNFEKENSSLGANVTFALECAILKAAAKERDIELWEFIFESFNKEIVSKLETSSNKITTKFPMPIGNCIGGGMHSRGYKGKKPDFQEFLIIPQEQHFVVAATKNFLAYERARKLLKKKQKNIFSKRNDEGAWETSLTNEEVLEILREAANKYGVRIGIDAATSTFFSGEYFYKNPEILRNREEQIEYIKILQKKFNLFYIEDPAQEEDFSCFSKLRLELKGSLITGDDLTVTNFDRVKQAIKTNSVNAVIIKPNQNGYLFEVSRVVKLCKEYGLKTIFSHRSGETMDDALADLAFGFQADFIKTGIHGKERLIKLRRMIEIEKSLRGS